MTLNSSIAIFSEVLAIDQRLRARLSKALPKGMELSQFSVLNYLATVQGERTPAQISDALHVSRGAMTNTLAKLEKRGDVNISPDWNDARRKLVSLSESGRLLRDMAIKSAAPVLEQAGQLNEDDARKLLAMLRQLRNGLE